MTPFSQTSTNFKQRLKQTANSSATYHTRVEVFEYRPEIWVGTKFGVGGDKLIGFFHDIRNVEATHADSQELLDAIKHGLIKGASQRMTG